MAPVTLPNTTAGQIEERLQRMWDDALAVAELAGKLDEQAEFRIWRKASARVKLIDAAIGIIGDRIDARQEAR